MTYLLDTNVISELRKRPPKVDPRVVAWSERQALETLHLSVVTVLELEIGITRMEHRDPVHGRLLRTWFERRVLVGFAAQIVPITLQIVRAAAHLHVPDPRPDRDALLAATAQVHGWTMVTRNSADFEGLGVPLINPWEDQ